jgi:hypothetical protein
MVQFDISCYAIFLVVEATFADTFKSIYDHPTVQTLKADLNIVTETDSKVIFYSAICVPQLA